MGEMYGKKAIREIVMDLMVVMGILLALMETLMVPVFIAAVPDRNKT